MNKRVSIIIPCKEIDRYTKECIKRCLELDYPDYEIIVLPDHAPQNNINSIKVIPTGPITPGAKRNIGITNSTGEICAFIDSDAYPPKDWLKNAIKYLADSEVAAVGGPGITPPEDSLMQRASGYVYTVAAFPSSLIGRFKAQKVRESDDIHSCNFITHRKILNEVKGWNEKYWPGEDTLLCLEIRKRGYKLIEAPDVIVYHHRKPLFKKHLKQVSQFALHRGFFAKKYRGNSLKLQYMAPSLITLTLFGGLLLSLIGNETLRTLYIVFLSIYLLMTLIASIIETKERKLIPPVWVGAILTHIIYGTFFIIGLLKKDLER